MRSVGLTLLCALIFGGLGCSFHARSAEDYRKDTRRLLETRAGDIKSCYDAELQKDAAVNGVVVLKFTVQAESGKIVNAQAVPERTTAPESLTQCVLGAIDGLALEPPDERNGDAEYTWEFKVNQG